MAETDDQLPLEDVAGFEPAEDRRPRMPEPLPVRIIAIEDVRLPAQAGLERKMDDFYVGLLQFVRDDERFTYRANNFSVHFDRREGLIVRDAYRPLVVEVLSLPDTERTLIESEVEYTRQRGLTPGTESLLLADPSGNPVEVVEARAII